MPHIVNMKPRPKLRVEIRRNTRRIRLDHWFYGRMAEARYAETNRDLYAQLMACGQGDPMRAMTAQEIALAQSGYGQAQQRSIFSGIFGSLF